MLRLRGARSGVVMQQIGRLFLEGTSIGSSEGELLDRFVRARDESAFEALVARHGPMVLGVCRHLLRDPNDVDDAFQATFLVLVRKAATLRQCELLGNWLYGVAMRARSQAARRSGRFGVQGAIEKLAESLDLADLAQNSASTIEREPEPWLHLEVSHLPEKYRTPIVLCYFEGLTHDEAASRMGCPLGTVKGRLSRARDLLRRRLTRRGVVLSAAALASQLTTPHAQAAVPASLELATTRAALAQISSAGASLAWGSSISIPVTALAEGVVRTMILNQVKVAAGAVLLTGTLAMGVVVGATQLAGRTDDGGETALALQTKKAAGGQRGAAAAKAAAEAAGKPAKTVHPDLLTQIESANRTFDHMLSRERNLASSDIDRLSNWSSLMLSADLVLSISDEDRTAARTAHRDRMKKLHAAILKLPVSAQNQTVNAQHAEEKLQEAESLLQSGDEQPTGAMGMAAMMRGMGGFGGTGGRGGRSMMGGMGIGGGAQGKSVRTPATKGIGGEASVNPPVGGMGAQPGAMAPSGFGGGAGMGGMAGGMGGGGAGMRGLGGGMGGGMAAGMGGEMGGGMAAMGGPGGGGGMAMMGGRGGRQRISSRAIVSSATALALRDKNPNSKQIHSSLELPVSMSFAAETPLEDILKYIKQATTTPKYVGIQIYVDPAGLREAAATTHSTVQVDFEGVPLKTSLRLMLKQLGLAYCVRDGLLIISSPEGILDELMEATQELESADAVKEEEEEKGDSKPAPE